MDTRIVNKHNITIIDFTALNDLMGDVYLRDIEEGIDLKKYTIYYANQYAYIVELWSVMLYEVKFLKVASQNKDAISDAITKRDYLEKIASVIKTKYSAVTLLLQYEKFK